VTLIYRPADFRRTFVDKEAELAALAEQLRTADAVGIDLEMTQRQERKPGGFQAWIHSLSLVQIASEEISAVIDPLRCRDLSALGPLLSGPTRKVFLGGGQDASLLEREGIPARHIVDVGEIALGIFGRREDGMAALARRIFGISLDKTVRRADWSRRPINPSLITYAHQDAELTLLIYRWFQENYPVVVAMHERTELDPSLPPASPPWLLEAMQSPTADVLVIVANHRIALDKDRDAVVSAVRTALRESTAPRQVNRLLRIAGDLGLKELLAEARSRVDSPSALIRASVARAVGRLAEREEGEPVLQALKEDQLEEVRKAAESALHDLRSPVPAAENEHEDDSTTLDESTISALEQLRKQLEGGN
jgi:Arc/MetJ family transcription regulator